MREEYEIDGWSMVGRSMVSQFLYSGYGEMPDPSLWRVESSLISEAVKQGETRPVTRPRTTSMAPPHAPARPTTNLPVTLPRSPHTGRRGRCPDLPLQHRREYAAVPPRGPSPVSPRSGCPQ